MSTSNRPAPTERNNLLMYRWRGLQQTPVTMPILVIGGTHDIVTKCSASDEIVRLLARARLRPIPAANHLAPFEECALYAGALADFVNEAESARQSFADEADESEDAGRLRLPGPDLG